MDFGNKSAGAKVAIAVVGIGFSMLAGIGGVAITETLNDKFTASASTTAPAPVVQKEIEVEEEPIVSYDDPAFQWAQLHTACSDYQENADWGHWTEPAGYCAAAYGASSDPDVQRIGQAYDDARYLFDTAAPAAVYEAKANEAIGTVVDFVNENGYCFQPDDSFYPLSPNPTCDEVYGEAASGWEPDPATICWIDGSCPDEGYRDEGYVMYGAAPRPEPIVVNYWDGTPYLDANDFFMKNGVDNLCTLWQQGQLEYAMDNEVHSTGQTYTEMQKIMADNMALDLCPR